jgi:hypothetical protein
MAASKKFSGGIGLPLNRRAIRQDGAWLSQRADGIVDDSAHVAHQLAWRPHAVPGVKRGEIGRRIPERFRGPVGDCAEKVTQQ